MELHQTQKLVAVDNHDYRVVCCGRQWGKTTLAVLEMVACAYAHSGRRIAYFATTFDQARSIAWTQLKELTRAAWAKPPNESRLELTIKTQDGGTSELFLAGFENIETRRGQQFDFLVIDEVSSMRNWLYSWQAILEPTLTFRRGKALFISTPAGYNHFYDMFQMGQGNSPYWKSWRFTSYDNPHLPKEKIDQAREDPKTASYFAQEYLADFTKSQGLVYAEWDMVEKYKPFDYDPNLPLHLSWDFGVNDPTAILWLQPNGSELRLVDYYEASNANIEHFVQVINAKPYKTPALETGDVAGNARELVSGKSPITELARLGHYVRTAVIPNIPTQVRVAHRFISRLYVSSSVSSCARFRDCLLNYRYPESKSATAIDQTNEIPIHDEYSHAMRAFEYYCWNSIDPAQRIDKTPPPGSFANFLRKKEEEKWLREEGYVA